MWYRPFVELALKKSLHAIYLWVTGESVCLESSHSSRGSRESGHQKCTDPPRWASESGYAGVRALIHWPSDLISRASDYICVLQLASYGAGERYEQRTHKEQRPLCVPGLARERRSLTHEHNRQRNITNSVRARLIRPSPWRLCDQVRIGTESNGLHCGVSTSGCELRPPLR